MLSLLFFEGCSIGIVVIDGPGGHDPKLPPLPGGNCDELTVGTLWEQLRIAIAGPGSRSHGWGDELILCTVSVKSF